MIQMDEICPYLRKLEKFKGANVILLEHFLLNSVPF